MHASEYSTVETLRDGRQVEIRALRPDDRDALLEAVSKMSDETLYRRFFAPRRTFSEKELDRFLNVDFVRDVALVAVLPGPGSPAIVGGGRYVATGPRRAEVAFGVEDAYQGQGIASALMRHLIVIARAAGLEALVAEVLAGNAPMLKVFERCGLPMTVRHEDGEVHVTLDLSEHPAAVDARGIRPK